jgi:hypothetical protein
LPHHEILVAGDIKTFNSSSPVFVTSPNPAAAQMESMMATMVFYDANLAFCGARPGAAELAHWQQYAL